MFESTQTTHFSPNSSNSKMHPLHALICTGIVFAISLWAGWVFAAMFGPAETCEPSGDQALVGISMQIGLPNVALRYRPVQNRFSFCPNATYGREVSNGEASPNFDELRVGSGRDLSISKIVSYEKLGAAIIQVNTSKPNTSPEEKSFQYFKFEKVPRATLPSLEYAISCSNKNQNDYKYGQAPLATIPVLSRITSRTIKTTCHWASARTCRRAYEAISAPNQRSATAKIAGDFLRVRSANMLPAAKRTEIQSFFVGCDSPYRHQGSRPPATNSQICAPTGEAIPLDSSTSTAMRRLESSGIREDLIFVSRSYQNLLEPQDDMKTNDYDNYLLDMKATIELCKQTFPPTGAPPVAPATGATQSRPSTR